VEAAGIEPASDSDVSDNATSICDNCGQACAARALHFGGTSGQSLSLDDSTGHCDCAAELESVAHAWPQLPQHVRDSILLLVQAAQGQ
jgi:hypothetical protein